MSDLGIASEPLHRSGDSVELIRLQHQRRMSALVRMESIMTKTRCSTEIYELSLAELELVSGGLIHEGTHAADSPTLGGGGQGGSWLEALARIMGEMESQAASRL